MNTLRYCISSVLIGAAFLPSGCAMNAETSSDGAVVNKAPPTAGVDEEGPPTASEGEGEGEGDVDVHETPSNESGSPAETVGIISGNGAHLLTPEILAL